MYLEHLGLVQQQMAKKGIGALLLFDPMNIRYTSGFANEQIFQSHTPSSYLFVPADGLTILHYRSDRPELLELKTLEAVRDAIAFTCFAAGPRVEERARAWACDIATNVMHRYGSEKMLAIDRIDPVGMIALQQAGVEVVHGHSILEFARTVKTPSDVACMKLALAVAEAGMAAMHSALRPGISENELWSILHKVNIAHGGEWIETRLLTSGERTNPWLQECNDKLIRPGELVAFDTDMIGPYGYCADVSRTFFCGPGRPSAEQKRLYRFALEQINHNMELIRPGVSFRELAEKSWEIPDDFVANRYPMIIHGVGMGDEYPTIAHPCDWDRIGYDGEIRENMTLCIENYIGSAGGQEGVKLEEQVLVTEDGCLPLSRYPYEKMLLS